MKTVSLDQAYRKLGIPQKFQKKYSSKSELFCRKHWQSGKQSLIFEAATNISQPSAVAWPDKQQRSDRPLKRTYAVAGQFVENHSIGQTLTAIARSGGLHYHTKGDEMEKN